MSQVSHFGFSASTPWLAQSDSSYSVRLGRAQTGESFGSVRAVAEQLGFGIESVRKWVHDADLAEGLVADAGSSRRTGPPPRRTTPTPRSTPTSQVRLTTTARPASRRHRPRLGTYKPSLRKPKSAIQSRDVSCLRTASGGYSPFMADDPVHELFRRHPIPYSAVMVMCAIVGVFCLVRYMMEGPVAAAVIAAVIAAGAIVPLMMVAYRRSAPDDS